MIKKITILYLILHSNLLLFGQNISILYQETLLMPEVLKTSGLPPSKLAQMENEFQQSAYLHILNIHNSQSSYIFEQIGKNTKMNLTSMNVYKDLQQKIWYRTPSKSEQVNFMSKEVYNPSDWEIQPEHQETILGYNTIKANLKSDPTIQAWFCPSIPIPEGPERYSGLPGLILKIKGNHKQWEAIKIMDDDDSLDFFFPEKITILNNMEWKKWLEQNRQDFLVKE